MASSEEPSELEIISTLDADLRAKGLIATNAVAQLLALLEPSRPRSVQEAAAHSVRRSLPRLTRAASAAGDNGNIGRWLQTRREEFAQRLASCIVSQSSEAGSCDAEGECSRALVACAAVQSESSWKQVMRAVVCEGKFDVVRDAVVRYSDLRLGALQVVLEPDSHITGWKRDDGEVLEKRGKIVKSANGRKAVMGGKSGKDAASSERYNGEPHICEPPSAASLLEARLRILHACGGDDTSHSSARATTDSADGGVVSVELKKKLRRAFGDAWLAVLAHSKLTSAQRAAAVASFPKNVIPRMSNPLRLSDFLVDVYDSSSSVRDTRVAVAALDALFLLISQHRLDYPDFYPALYQRLTPYAIFEAPERQRFLSLTATFLTRGSYLPRTMVAAFVKRLARRALVAPPAGAMWCLRLALDLLHRHPSVSYLVHKSVDLFETPTTGRKGSMLTEGPSASSKDPYDDSVADPLASGAERSSLWELEALRKHMSPAVSRLVEAFSRDVRKRPPPPPGDLNDYASLGFSDVFGAEFKRRAKSIPLAYQAPDPSSLTDVEKLLAPAIQWR